MYLKRFLGALITAALMLVAGTAASQTCPGGASFLVPRNCSGGACANPSFNGFLDVVEYADATRIPLQDFREGSPNGTMFIEADRSTLFIGLSDLRGLPGGEPGCSGEFCDEDHNLVLMFDGNRPAGTTIGCSSPGVEDRLIDFQIVVPPSSSMAHTVNVRQYKGNGTSWVPVGSAGLPITDFFLRRTYSAMNTIVDLNLEIGIDLSSLPVPSGEFGLGLQFVLPGDELPSEARYVLPNDRFQAPDQLQPGTWETIAVRAPNPTLMGVATYNTNMLPWGALQDGAGEPLEFGIVAFFAEHICFQELWDHDDRMAVWEATNLVRAMVGLDPAFVVGLPQERDLAEDLVDYVVDSVTHPSLGIILDDPILGDLLGFDREDTGLLFISQRPITDAVLAEYQTQCSGEDCFEDKGFIWARVLTDASVDGGLGAVNTIPIDNPLGTVPTFIVQPTETSYGGDEFIDVYCTHLQANPEVETADPKQVRADQLNALKLFIDASRATDRPAVVVGDFNFSGNKTSASSEYVAMLSTLGISSISPFDTANTWLSDRYDLGMFLDAAGGLLTDPLPSGLPGFGTQIKDANCSPPPDPTTTSRYDYILVLPATGSPRFGVAGAVLDISGDPFALPFVIAPGTFPNPEDPTDPEGKCLSDHALLVGFLGIVRVEQQGKWNPAKDHIVSAGLKNLTTITEDCLFCGGQDFYGDIFWTVFGSADYKSFGPIDDDDSPFFGSAAMTPEFQFAGVHFDDPFPGQPQNLMSTVTAVFEDDAEATGNGDDPVDITGLSGRPAFFRFRHFEGLWEQWTNNFGSFDKFSCDLNKNRTGCEWPTRGKSGKERSAAIHEIVAVELP